MADSVRVAEGVGGLALGIAAGLALAVQVLSLFVIADHWCWDANVAALRVQLPLDAEDAKKFSLPRVDSAPRLPFWSVSNGEDPEFSRCERYDGDLVGAYVGWVAARRPPYREENGSKRTTCDQGWEYNITQGFHSLTAQMNWVCESSWKAYLADTAYWIGGALGAAITIAIANRWGRGVAVLSSVTLALLGCAGSLAVVSSTALVWVTRASLGLSYLPLLAVLKHKCGRYPEVYSELLLYTPGLYTVQCYVLGPFAIYSEALDLLEDRRTLTPLYLCMSSLLAPWLATYLGYWWYMTAVLVAVVAIAFCISCWFSLEEILKKLSKAGLGNISPSTRHDRYSLECPIVVDCSEESKTNLTKESKMPAQNRFASELVRFLCGLCYYGNVYSSTTLLGSQLYPKRALASFCYTALAEIPAWGFYHVPSDAVFSVSLAGAAFTGIAHSLVPSAEAYALGMALFLVHRLLIASAFHHLRLRNSNSRSPYSQLLQGMSLAAVPCILYTREYYSHLPSFLFGSAAVMGFILRLTSDTVRFKRLSFPFDSMDRKKRQRKETLVISSLPYNPMNT